MAVRIRMKRMGRRHRPFYRICAVDGRSPRDGRVIEELGHYDPMIGETDARAQLKQDRISYWLGVGAQPSDNVAVLIKKYGENGTHLEAQQAALAKIQANRPTAPPPVKVPEPEKPADESAPAEAATEPASEKASDEAAAAEAPATEAATPEASEQAAEPAAEEPKAEEPKAEGGEAS